jgi:hypothetical protein
MGPNSGGRTGAWRDLSYLSRTKWNGPAALLPHQRLKLAKGAKDKERAMSQRINTAIAVIGIRGHMVRKALQDAHAVIAFCSENSRDSHYVAIELEIAKG